MKNGVLNSTRPRAFRGALSRSTITAFSGSAGSTSKSAVPVSRSYAPADPHSTPPANGSRCSIVRRTSAASPRAETRTTAAAIAIRTINVLIASILRLGVKRQPSRAAAAFADDHDQESNQCGDQHERDREQDERNDGVHLTSWRSSAVSLQHRAGGRPPGADADTGSRAC